ncbi:MAG: N-glycosylase/DNA lyase [Hadesarchaea archaeon]|nr:N-glycosylase/DNA lyase [Hadesarchaea archaeon]
MQDLVNELEELKHTEVRKLVEERISEFKSLNKKEQEKWFSELCFCILTANSSAELCIKIQDELGPQGFLELSKNNLTSRLKDLGHRFYRTRAEYIVEARKHSNLKRIITGFSEPPDAREWLVQNVKGIGYKEGSHFLRNVGYDDLMIIDRHILRTITEWNVIEEIPKTLTKNKYLKIEEKLTNIARKAQLSLAELDLYLWYTATGKVLK